MWTPATGRQHNRESLRYETDLTDQERNLIAPMMPPVAETGRSCRWWCRSARWCRPDDGLRRRRFVAER